MERIVLALVILVASIGSIWWRARARSVSRVGALEPPRAPLVLHASAGSETSASSAPSDAYDEFWIWFSGYASVIRDAPTQTTDAISERLQRVDDRLAWEVTPGRDGGDWIFTISADGFESLFPVVEAMKAAAPEVAGWKVDAFRQRGSLGASIKFRGRHLGGDDVWFDVKRRSPSVAVRVHIRGLERENASELVGAATLLIDNAVGEYDAVRRLELLDVDPLPADPRAKGLIPLAEILTLIDALKN